MFSIVLDSLGQNDNRKTTSSCCLVTDILNITWITGAKFTKHLRTILRQFYDILHTHANVLIQKSSYDNFTTEILRLLFRCFMTFRFIRFHHHPTNKTFLYLFIRPLIQLYSQSRNVTFILYLFGVVILLDKLLMYK